MIFIFVKAGLLSAFIGLAGSAVLAIVVALLICFSDLQVSNNVTGLALCFSPFWMLCSNSCAVT